MKLCKLLILVLLIACSKDDEPLVQLITEISAFDVGNDGNSSDIRVKFRIESIAGISEFRIIVIPSELSEGFTKTQALKLSSGSYTTVQPSSDPDYSVRMSAISDIMGSPIENNEEYVIKILMDGDGFNQLSIIESNVLILTDQGIYNGYYEGTIQWRGRIDFEEVFFDGQGDPLSLNAQFSLSESGGYFGVMNLNHPFDGESSSTVNFEVKEDVITTFTSTGSDLGLIGRIFKCGIPLLPVIATGIIREDLILEIAVDNCTDHPGDLPGTIFRQSIEFVGGGFSLKRVIPDDE